MNSVTRDFIESERRSVANDIARATEGDRDVMLPATLVFLSTNVVLPIVCGLASSAVYDTIKNALKAGKADEAVSLLVEDDQAKTLESATDLSDFTSDAVACLLDAGVPNDKAEDIVESCITRLRDRI